MSKNTTDELREQLDELVSTKVESNRTRSGFEVMYDPDYLIQTLEALISNREKLAYRSGYAAGNAKKNYRKKVDAETVEQLKTEITAGVLSTLRKELDGEAEL